MNTPCPLGSIEWPQRPPYLIRERGFWLLRSIYATASLLKFARAKTSRPVLNAGSQWKEGLEGEDGKAVTSPVLKDAGTGGEHSPTPTTDRARPSFRAVDH